MKLNFRLHTNHDVDNLVDLWCHHADWDIIDRDAWENRFYNTPYGNSEIVVAENCEDGSLLAQFIFLPSRIFYAGKSYSGFRPFAPIIHRRFREKIGFIQMMKYILSMYDLAVRHFKANGVVLTYVLPDPRWVRLLHLKKGIKTGFFPLFSLAVNESLPFKMTQGYSFVDSIPESKCIDQLWEKASATMPCCNVRDASALVWKMRQRSYHCTTLYHHDRLAGLCLSMFKPDDKQWLICDMIAENSSVDFNELLKAACWQAISFKDELTPPEQSRFSKIAVLATRTMEDQLTKLGFREDNYRFPLIVHQLNRQEDGYQFEPKDWYISAND